MRYLQTLKHIKLFFKQNLEYSHGLYALQQFDTNTKNSTIAWT